jgi:hypothetical protein
MAKLVTFFVNNYLLSRHETGSGKRAKGMFGSFEVIKI